MEFTSISKQKHPNEIVTETNLRPTRLGLWMTISQFLVRRYIMTKNQIEYNKVLETRRSNYAQEDLTRRRDQAARDAKLIELGEASRHNQALEGLQGRSLDETSRHNRESERNQREVVSESRRHNLASERVNLMGVQESTRHNRAAERETNRSNLAHEEETKRSNQAREDETKRSNLVDEGISAGRLAMDAITREQQIAETKRHNMAMELKDYSTKVSLTPTQTVTTVPNSSSVVELDNTTEPKKGNRHFPDPWPRTGRGFTTFGGENKEFGGKTK